VPKFTTADTRKVPALWCQYDGRRSVLGKGNSNKKAERPTNAVLNLLYKLVEIEGRLACVAVGLDPGLGALHLDTESRDSLVPDVIEPVRPQVERFVIDLMGQSVFTRKDFIERSDGSIRIGPELAQRLSATLPMWAKAVAPYAEKVAHSYGDVVAGKWTRRTPLTGRNAKAAAAVVRARKSDAVAKGRRSAVARAVAPRTDTSRAASGFAGCIDCGGPLDRPRHIRCSTCWDKQPAQSADVRRRRGSAISVARSAQERWARDNPDGVADREDFRRRILPGLKGVPLSQIMAATGCAKATASSYKTGKTTPHPMYWKPLRSIVDQAVIRH